MTNITNADINEAQKLIKKGQKEFDKNNIAQALKFFEDAHKIAISVKDVQYVSICMSWMSYLGYLKEPKRYFKALSLLNDAKYLADTSYAKVTNIYAAACIEGRESSKVIASKILKKAIEYNDIEPYLHLRILYELASLTDELSNSEEAYNYYNQSLLIAEDLGIFVKDIKNKIEKLKDAHKNDKKPLKIFEKEQTSKDPLIALLRVGRTIAVETNIDKLLTIIAEETKLALNADRCTVFMLDKEKNELWSKVALGMESQEIRFASNLGLAGHVATTGETINIKEAYNDPRFNKDIDQRTGYRTKTILCMPIRNINHEIVGVFQVLNKLEGQFSETDEDLLIAIGSSAGIALENARLFNHQQKMLEEQKSLFSSFIDTLSASIDARDKITSGHSFRVTLYATLIAQELEIDEKEVELIRQGAILHDIGKIGIRDSVLQKEGKLTPEEYAHIQQHATITHDILNKIYHSKDFSHVVDIASTHHEKYDGTGYFKKLKGDNIPLGGRILAVSDVFDAITSRRHYRDKMEIEKAIEILIEGSNKHFDKKIVDAFLNITLDKIAKILVAQDEKTLNEGHASILAKYKLRDLYYIITNKNEHIYSDEEKMLIRIFDLYYSNKTQPTLP